MSPMKGKGRSDGGRWRDDAPSMKGKGVHGRGRWRGGAARAKGKEVHDSARETKRVREWGGNIKVYNASETIAPMVFDLVSVSQFP